MKVSASPFRRKKGADAQDRYRKVTAEVQSDMPPAIQDLEAELIGLLALQLSNLSGDGRRSLLKFLRAEAEVMSPIPE